MCDLKLDLRASEKTSKEMPKVANRVESGYPGGTPVSLDLSWLISRQALELSESADFGSTEKPRNSSEIFRHSDWGSQHVW